MELVSVIVPIYNMEKRLNHCLSKIKNQTYGNLEILLVDDGSKDGSAKICQSFCHADSRFHYLYKKNGGNPSACNYGVKAATGTWITFCDSDDWFGENHIQNLVTAITQDNVDIAIGGYKLVDDNSKVYETRLPGFNGTMSKEALATAFWHLYEKSLINTVWNKLYKRSVINTLMDESMTCGQDLFFNMRNFSNALSFALTDAAEYYYYFPINAPVKYPKNDARQCKLYSSSVRTFFESSLPEADYIKGYKKFLCGNICRDTAILAKTKPYKEAKRMINQFFDYPEFNQVLIEGVWKDLSRNYQLVGRLLKYRMVSLLIVCAKMK